MSYCRWSSDNFACDLYAYEYCGGGYTIHVAGNRHVGECPQVDWDGFMADRIDAQTIADQYKVQHDWLMACEREPITLACAGETFREPDLAAFRARLSELRALGFRFPDHVLETVDAELADAQPATVGA